LLLRLYILFLILLSATSFSQKLSKDSLSKRISHYLAKDNHEVDSLLYIITEYKKQKDLSNSDLVYGYDLYARFIAEMELFEKAIEEFKLAKEVISATNPEKDSLTAQCNQHIANIFFTLQKYDSCFYYAKQAFNKIPRKNILTNSENYQILGYQCFLNKDYTTAIDYYDKAISVRTNTKFECGATLVSEKKIRCYVALGQTALAIKLAKESASLAKECGDSNSEKLLYKFLSEEFEKSGNFKNAYYFQRKYFSITDSLSADLNKVSLAEVEAKFTNKLKTQENTLLKTENTNKQQLISRQNWIIILGSISIIVFITLLILFYRTSKQRKKLNLALSEQRDKIQIQNLQLERQHLLNQKIFSVVSHDFKEPLLSLELLLHNEKSIPLSSYERQKETVKQQLKQANLIMDNLLNWAKTELNIKPNQQVVSNPYSIANEIILQLHALMEPKKINPKNNIPATNSVNVPPDIVRIIFRNLLSNAIKYSYNEGDINLNYDVASDTYAIQDYGMGIPPDRLKLIFNQQVQSKLGTHNESGHGIGLNFVAELIHKYNGKIWMESKEEEETTVYFSFNKSSNGKPLVTIQN
jgi:signal transduction histidine kinase